MKRIGCIAVWIACAASLGTVSSASAQSPDMRDIFPYLMLVIDTSGSMERMPACVCDDLPCVNCLPTCNPTSGSPQKNRWATTLEALTGTFNNFKCEPLVRSVDNGATYDIGYYLPYHQPWDCNTQSAGSDCAFNSANSTRDQNANGILDEYKGRVNFGLMTFDGWETYVGADRLVPVTAFNEDLSEDVQGLWSYGGAKSFHYPNCDTDYMMDTGARSSVATEGSLVSLNSCRGTAGSPTCPSWCGACWNTDPTEITNQLNEDIQEALLTARPYGGTPIAASLDDLYHHFKTDLTDTFAGCRSRFALLMTDGEPDKDYRDDLHCDCAELPGPNPCGVGQDPTLMKCPYPTPETAAYSLVHGRTMSETAVIERLFVVGLDVGTNQAIVDRLDDIALSGCTEGAACVDPVTTHAALFANNVDTLVSNLGDIIDDLLHPLSRSVPVLVGATAGSGFKQYQVGTGFVVPKERDAPWYGLIERRRFSCTGTTLVDEVTADDLLHDKINAEPTPTLLTALPETGFSANGWLYGSTSGSPCGTPTGSDPTGCTLVNLNDTTVDTEAYGLGAVNTTTTARRLQIVNWMYGATGSPRATKKLGDIYHSSPVVLGRPQFDTVDEAFNEFRQLPVVKDRPLTMFVNTNDGMIRAISLETFAAKPTPSPYGTNIAAGKQLWGFVPPLLVDDLEDNLTDHRITMDGTAVIKDVYFNRTRGSIATTNANQYHSVLITGMRGGGQGTTNAYIALDVTNPTQPKFLWQFTDPAMGKTYAQPGIAQAVYQFDTGLGSTITKNGAVAILPGGVGTTGPSGVSGDCTNGITNPSMRNDAGQPFVTHQFPYPVPGWDATANQRVDIRCWRDNGRALFFVDIETGRLIKKIYLDSTNKRIFPSPLVSTPAVFPGEVGTVASQAYVTDADGVIWRIDMRAVDPVPTDPKAGWTVRPFHDIFWDRSPTEGEVSYEAPILSVDTQGRPVVIVGTGDTDNLAKTTVQNRVVSMTEVFDNTSVGLSQFERYRAAFNWEKRVKATGGLVTSEAVTGSMALFGGQLFFPTFIAVSGSDACDMGKGRIFAVDYLAKNIDDLNQIGSTPINTYGPMPINGASFSTTGDAAEILNATATDAETNLLILGLSVAQRPSCATINTTSFDEFDPYFGAIGQLEPPAMQLVAQGGGLSTMLRTTGAGALQSLDLKLNKPRTSARVMSWATSTE